MLIVAVYLLISTGRVEPTVVNATPAPYRDDMEELLTTIGRTLSLYLGGLLLSTEEQATPVALTRWLLGGPYAFLIGLPAGVMPAPSATVPQRGVRVTVAGRSGGGTARLG